MSFSWPCNTNRIFLHVHFCDWLLPRDTTVVKLYVLCAVVCSFPSVCTYCLITHPPVDRHFGSFQFGAILTSAAMRIPFQVFESTDKYISVGIRPRMGLLGQRVHIYSVLAATLEKQFSKVFPSVCVPYRCSTFLPTVFSFCFHFAILWDNIVISHF